MTSIEETTMTKSKPPQEPRKANPIVVQTIKRLKTKLLELEQERTNLMEVLATLEGGAK